MIISTGIPEFDLEISKRGRVPVALVLSLTVSTFAAAQRSTVSTAAPPFRPDTAASAVIALVRFH